MPLLDILGGPATVAPNGLYEGKVARTIVSAGQELQATLDAFSPDLLFGPMPYPQRPGLYPVAGDPILVALTDDQTTWCVAWNSLWADPPVPPVPPAPPASVYRTGDNGAAAYTVNSGVFVEVDAVDLKGTIVCTGTRALVIQHCGTIVCAAGGNIGAVIRYDGVDIPGRIWYEQSGTIVPVSGFVVVPAPTAGAHTFSLAVATAGGVATLYNEAPPAVSGNLQRLHAYEIG